MATTPIATKPHDALAVANYFLGCAAECGTSIDPLKLQKLVYFAHGWHLALTGKPLFWQTVLAWPHGPVIRDVYHEFKHNGYRPIDGKAVVFDPQTGERVPYSAMFSPVTRQVLDRVWEVYKPYSGVDLSAMAHDEGTPWHQVAAGREPKKIRDVPIPNEMIRRHYQQLASQRQGMKR